MSIKKEKKRTAENHLKNVPDESIMLWELYFGNTVANIDIQCPQSKNLSTLFTNHCHILYKHLRISENLNFHNHPHFTKDRKSSISRGWK